MPRFDDAPPVHRGHSLQMILADHWDLVESDLAQFYGIDCEDAALMRGRSWRWLRSRIDGLLNLPPTVVVYPDGNVQVLHATRLGCALNPPEPVAT